MKKDLNMQIGSRIRIKREELKLSREKLAECIDVSPQFLAQIELGRRGMSTTTLYKICNALSASADYIVLGKQEKNDLNVFHEMLSNLNPKYLPYAEDLLKTFILAVNK
ncbi:helix-turn-helix domain-containing protein [Anaerovorax sp. IOR16]|uniref:helix-turn-helix domain-containing protein n=1 Tax=Anaerovorax sp. IOR16 TaxID=2773458 RepID=UPI0019D06BD1|nr:helix-turn-helix transcriptional regulator [Anaerovorax sp. IOR16]